MSETILENVDLAGMNPRTVSFDRRGEDKNGRRQMDDIDADILGPVERRIRVEADLKWLREEIRTHRRYAEITMNDDLRLEHTKTADAYQAAVNRAEERLMRLWAETQ